MARFREPSTGVSGSPFALKKTFKTVPLKKHILDSSDDDKDAISTLRTKKTRVEEDDGSFSNAAQSAIYEIMESVNGHLDTAFGELENLRTSTIRLEDYLRNCSTEMYEQRGRFVVKTDATVKEKDRGKSADKYGRKTANAIAEAESDIRMLYKRTQDLQDRLDTFAEGQDSQSDQLSNRTDDSKTSEVNNGTTESGEHEEFAVDQAFILHNDGHDRCASEETDALASVDYEDMGALANVDHDEGMVQRSNDEIERLIRREENQRNSLNKIVREVLEATSDIPAHFRPGGANGTNTESDSKIEIVENGIKAMKEAISSYAIDTELNANEKADLNRQVSKQDKVIAEQGIRIQELEDSVQKTRELEMENAHFIKERNTMRRLLYE